MSDYAKLNVELSEKAREAREVARQASSRALAVARQCRVKEGETVAPDVKAQASQLGKEAYAARKAAKEVAAEAASARRVACFRALPPKEVPTLPKPPLKRPPRPTTEP